MRLRLGSNTIPIPTIISNKCIKCTITCFVCDEDDWVAFAFWIFFVGCFWWFCLFGGFFGHFFGFFFFFWKQHQCKFWNISWSSNALSKIKTRKLLTGLHFALVNKIFVSLGVWGFFCFIFLVWIFIPWSFFPWVRISDTDLNSRPLVLNASSLSVRAFIEVFPSN